MSVRNGLAVQLIVGLLLSFCSAQACLGEEAYGMRKGAVLEYVSARVSRIDFDPGVVSGAVKTPKGDNWQWEEFEAQERFLSDTVLVERIRTDVVAVKDSGVDVEVRVMDAHQVVVSASAEAKSGDEPAAQTFSVTHKGRAETDPETKEGVGADVDPYELLFLREGDTLGKKQVLLNYLLCNVYTREFTRGDEKVKTVKYVSVIIQRVVYAQATAQPVRTTGKPYLLRSCSVGLTELSLDALLRQFKAKDGDQAGGDLPPRALEEQAHHDRATRAAKPETE